METGAYHHKNLRQELIDAGVRLVAGEGAEALSLRRLAAECGVTHAAPYKHFQNKEEILRAVTAEVFRIFAVELRETLAVFSVDSPQKQLVELGKCYVRFTLEHPEFARLMFFYGSGSATSDKLRESGETAWSPLAIFRDAAIAYLRSLRIPPEQYEYRIVSLWALVHGLAQLLQNRNWVPDCPVPQAVEQVLLAACEAWAEEKGPESGQSGGPTYPVE